MTKGPGGTRSELVDIEIKVEWTTGTSTNDGGILVRNSRGTKVWLPKSQVQMEGKVGEVCTLTMPRWLAEDRELD